MSNLTLRQKQSLFVRLIGKLIEFAEQEGYELTFGPAYDPPESNSGRSPGSLHRSRLAIDLNLFKNNKFLETTEDHKVLGEYWERLHPLCRWGGRFEDGNHYSLEHEGRK